MKKRFDGIMTLGEYAAYRRVSTTTVHGWKRKGLVVQDEDSRRINVQATDRNLEKSFGLRAPNVVDPNGRGDDAAFGEDEDQTPDESDDSSGEDDIYGEEVSLTDEEIEGTASYAEDLEDADLFLKEATKPGKKKYTDKEIYVKSRSVNELIKATRERIKLQQLMEEVIDRAEVIDKIFKMSRRNRDGWLNWPKTVAIEMASELGISDHRKVHDILLRMVKENLENVSKIEIEIAEDR